ncbi:bifunctional aldolase/short-chain dehydrogenase [Streptomyces sp. SID1328]|uniref:bifunctional aldolase/short-chain dehydrogenase n=1 Tax=Streptomyces sp. SID1328 TaxID=2690250 RepID=UPI00136A41A2|nr:bifunctional aldolase/short-chain dehydrogenase [Streptomyces sp. SID1328]MYV41618.1 bifunctional aldolase/short-chain dehydrogenase [Streptomyces sp. SID1328]
MTRQDDVVGELLTRAHRLGADPRNTNYAGGNASAKGTAVDPVTGDDIGLLWVKGSGGDLGTLTPEGLAVLRLDRLRALAGVHPGVEAEDRMVAAFDYCLHGKGGAAPSIDTAMHALVDTAHVDHLHPDSGIALACAADGEKLTAECFGEQVVWVPWQRPGFQLGLDIARVKEANPRAIGVILGGHGITAWGDTSAECERNSLHIIRTAEAFLAARGRAEPFGHLLAEYAPLEPAARRERAAALAPTVRALASRDLPQVGHFDDSAEILEFLSRAEHPRLAALGTSCPDHFLRTKVRPLVLDLPPAAPLDEVLARLRDLHAAYREEYAAYYARHAGPDSPAMRGADPAIVLVPGVGMFSFGRDKQTARVAGEFYRNAVNVMRGAEAVSSYAPIEEREKFRIEYWELEEAKLRRMPRPRPLATRIALVTGAGSGIGRAIAHRLAAEGACVVVADVKGAEAVAEELGGADRAVAVTVDVTSEEQIAAAFRRAVLAFGGVDLVVNCAGISVSRPLLETTARDWDLQHAIMARGSFLVSREAARVMTEQQLGGDIIYIASKNSVFAGPDNIAYSAAKADQAHQVRLLAAELGKHGIRVNGVNPDGVVRGSGIFAGGWGARRAAAYGIPEDELGAFYARRTLLGREVLPEHVANAVFALTGGDLTHTTGTHIPVDAGVAAAFLR